MPTLDLYIPNFYSLLDFYDWLLKDSNVLLSFYPPALGSYIWFDGRKLGYLSSVEQNKKL